MTYKTIAVSLNDVPRAGAVLDAAAAIAGFHGAHLIGCYIVPAPIIYPEVGFSAVSGVYDGHQAYFKEHLADTKLRFEKKLSQTGLTGEWRETQSVHSSIAPGVLEHGYGADLIVASQVAADEPGYVENDLVERLAMESGRPVLMVPQKGSFAGPASAIVGFNATRESARAIFDSVPLLRMAKEVRVVWVDPQSERSIAGDVPGAEIAKALARHGIKATAEGLAAGGIDAGAALLQRARDTGADLVVMGAYAHSRLREYIFCGATLHVLENAEVPVLMSH
jgi:nucleotide-binding universal stress UspA family protein